MCKGGSNTQTTTNQSTPPPAVASAWSNLISNAQNVANTPYSTFAGQTLAPGQAFDPSFWASQGSGLVAGMSPYTQAALGAASGIGALPGGYNAASLGALGGATSLASGLPAYSGQLGRQLIDTGGTLGNQISSGAQTAAGNIADFGTGAGANIGTTGADLGHGVSSYATNAVAGGPQLQQFSGQAVGQYMSPYTQHVIDTTMANINRNNAIQSNNLQGSAIASGNAFGGDRAGVAQSELARNQDLASGQIIANLENQGYSQALGQFNTNNAQALQGTQLGLSGLEAGSQMGLGAQEFGSQLGLGALSNAGNLGLSGNTAGANATLAGMGQGSQIDLTGQQMGLAGLSSLGGMYGNLGQQAQQEGLAGQQALYGAGAADQQQQQAGINAAYQQYQQYMGYPFQSTGWLGNVLGGTAGMMGGSSTTTAPGPSMLSQLGGLGLTGVGVLGGTGAFGSAGWLAPALLGLKRGGSVTSTVPEKDVTLDAQQRQLLSGDRDAQMFPNGTQELPLPHGMERVKTANGVFHYNPDKISASAIEQATALGRENDVLGLGPYSKQDVLAHLARGESPVALVERDHHGNEVRAAAGTNGTAPHQAAAMGGRLSPGHSLHLEDIRHTLAGRHFEDGGGVGGAVGGLNLSGLPYQGASLVPALQAIHGSGIGIPHAPAAHHDTSVADFTKQAASLGDVWKGMRPQTPGKPLDLSPPQTLADIVVPGMSPAINTPTGQPIYQRGGMVRGYDDGGTIDLDESDIGGLPQDVPAAAMADWRGRTDNILAAAQSQATRDPAAVRSRPADASPPPPPVRTLADAPAASAAHDPVMGKPDPWLSLAAAGFGMMAGQSPFALSNVGQGGLAGLQNYAAQQKEAREKFSVETRSKQLQEEAERHRKQMALETKKLTEISPYQKAQLALGERQRSAQEAATNLARERYEVPPGFRRSESGDLEFIPHGPQDPEVIRNKANAAAGWSVSPDALTKTGDEFLRALPSDKAGVVKKVANYEINPGTIPMKDRERVMEAAVQYNPDFNQTYFREANDARTKFGSGTTGNSVRSFSTAISHLDVANNLIDAMNSGDTKLINYWRQKFQTEFGTSAAPNSFDAIRPIVSGEIVKAVQGANGALGDREEVQKGLNAAFSPTLLKDVTSNYQKLMGGQLVSLKRQYETSTHGAKDFEEKLSPAARDMLRQAETTESAYVPKGTAAPTGSAPRVGERKQFKQGWGVWNGTTWAPE